MGLLYLLNKILIRNAPTHYMTRINLSMFMKPFGKISNKKCLSLCLTKHYAMRIYEGVEI
jgi:hypothetical protein